MTATARFTCSILVSLLVFLLIPPEATNAQTMDELKSCVTFVYIPDSEHPGKLRPNGTGFFLTYVSPDTSKHLNFTYFVTAKHVIWDTASKNFKRGIRLRLNLKKGGSGYYDLNLVEMDRQGWVFLHKDTTVDLIAVNVVLPEEADTRSFPFKGIKTQDDLERLGLVEGTDVCFPAMFVYYLGTDRIHPMVRFGKIALMTNERISFTKQMQRLILIESIAIGGNSGAPVMAWFEPLAKPDVIKTYEPRRMSLIGVMEGYWGEWKRLKDWQVVTGADSSRAEAHTGISAIVPAQLLRDILLSPEAKKQRGF